MICDSFEENFMSFPGKGGHSFTIILCSNTGIKLMKVELKIKTLSFQSNLVHRLKEMRVLV